VMPADSRRWPDSGAIFVNGVRIDALTEMSQSAFAPRSDDKFRERAFDSLTVVENVGYRLVRDNPADGRRRRSSGSSGSANMSTPCRHSFRRPAPARGHRAWRCRSLAAAR
jgi:hypothetical protein